MKKKLILLLTTAVLAFSSLLFANTASARTEISAFIFESGNFQRYPYWRHHHHYQRYPHWRRHHHYRPHHNWYY